MQITKQNARIMSTICVDNPYTLETYCKVTMSSEKEALDMVQQATQAQQAGWKNYSGLKQRQEICKKWMQEVEKNKESIAIDITGQMGKPLRQSYGEINGTLERAKLVRGVVVESFRVKDTYLH